MKKEQAVNGNRLHGIDFVRGLGMILVILGHCSIPDPFWKIIYMFHMPLFFFVSGLCHKWGGILTDQQNQLYGIRL